MSTEQNIAYSHTEIEFLGNHFSDLGEAMHAVNRMLGVSEQDRSNYINDLIQNSRNEIQRLRAVERSMNNYSTRKKSKIG